jgi:endonuclease/exonuclease/phosphatase family metal-dependent hydrolase
MVVLLVLIFVVPSVSAEELKVVTLNIWSGLDYEGVFKFGEYESDDVREVRYEKQLEMLKSLDPDILATNENTKLPRNAKYIAKSLGMDYVYHVAMGGIRVGNFGIPVNYREGDVIFARPGMNLTDGGRAKLSGGGIIGDCVTIHTTESRQVICGIVEIRGRDVYIFNAHIHASVANQPWVYEKLEEMYESGEMTEEEYLFEVEDLKARAENRAEEVRGILRFIEETVPAGAPIILLGDFNAEVAAPEIQQIIDAGFIDTYGLMNPDDPGYTWDPEKNQNIIDYYTPVRDTMSVGDQIDYFAQYRIDLIFVGGGLTEENVVESRLVLDELVDGQHPSDHFGVMTILDIP